MLLRIAAILLLASLAAAEAAPNIPPGEMPGRERQRFQDSPVERFMQAVPPGQAEPVWQWRCEDGKPKAKSKRGKQSKAC
jgi:hypothetical protein